MPTIPFRRRGGVFVSVAPGRRAPTPRRSTVGSVVARDCPYCGAYADFDLRHEWTMPRRNVPMGAWTCRACDMPVAGFKNSNGDPGEVQPVDARTREFPDVPASIAADAAEAFRCRAVAAWRGTAAMARRAIQQSCLDKGAPDKRLVDQIDWLAASQLISPQMKDVAHHLRSIGNVGAHPDKDGLEDVDEEAADAALVFLCDFLRYVYEIPASLARIAPQATPPASSP